MKPTCNGNDLYQVGNDYPQEASAYFYTDSYADGIYTSGKFDMSAAEGLNKRILNVEPGEFGTTIQSAWNPGTIVSSGEEVEVAASAFPFASDDYATATFSAFDNGEEA